MNYGIQARPTVYGATLFRSRLEARWAVFLNAVGAEWGYEPEDLDIGCEGYGLTPDFVIQSIVVHRFGFSERSDDTFMSMPLLLEVKPRGFDDDQMDMGTIAHKYIEAAKRLVVAQGMDYVAVCVAVGDPFSAVENGKCYYAIVDENGAIYPFDEEWERVEPGRIVYLDGALTLAYAREKVSSDWKCRESARLANMYDFKGYMGKRR